MKDELENVVPKLNKNVIVQDFDTSSINKKYIIILGRHQWVVSKAIRNILMSIDGKRSMAEIIAEINKENNMNQDTILKIVNDMLRVNKIIDSESDGNEDKKENSNSNGNINLWIRKDILKASFVKKFKFLTFFYNKNVFRVMGVCALILEFSILMKLTVLGGVTDILALDFRTVAYTYIIALIITIFHELGHASAAMNFGIEPGNIGIGLYFMFPVFYSDVSKTWRLKRLQRVIVDIGGMYFESIGVLILFLSGIIFNNKYLYISSVLLVIENLRNINPFIKLDGYWVFSDSLGIPNLHQVSRTYLKKSIGRKLDEKETSLLKHFAYDIGFKEKIIFHIYTGLMFFFMIFVSYFMCKMIMQSCLNISGLVNAIIGEDNLSFINNPKKIIIWLNNNFMNLVFIIYLIRMTFKGILVIKNMCINLIKKSKKQSKGDENNEGRIESE